MKKNTIKKSLSIMATLSLFAVSTACYSVSAAETDVNLYIDRITAKPGETVSVNVGTRNSNVAYDTVGLLVNYDEGLTYVDHQSSYAPTVNSSGRNLFFTISRDNPLKGDVSLIAYRFTVPEDAAPGTRYNIQFTNLLNAEGQPDPTLAIARRLNLYNVSVDSNAFLPYTVQQGYIEVAADVVTTPAVTTTPEETTTTVTTPEVTDINSVTTPASGSSATDITTVSTPSSTTTSRATTTTARTTTTTKSSATSSPKTGDATKGVIPAMAAMAAAALAAFVVRKKK